MPTKGIKDIYILFGIKCPDAIDFTSEGGLDLEPERKKEKVQKTADGNKDVPKMPPGRPKGSLNRKTLERMRLGRRNGSKNKKSKDTGK